MPRKIRLLALALGLGTPLLAGAAGPQAPAPQPAPADATQGAITLTRWTLDAGGTTSAVGGAFRLGSSIGQPEAALVGGGSYRLSAGFWAPESGGDGLFANGFE
ncbi:MAG: hypothetical protein JNL89_12025 [Rhodanobacteraceae bacterium]|nr:hypothetical protein [Rhodanobacteraceae bacterium]